MKNYIDIIGRNGNSATTKDFDNGGQVANFSVATTKTINKQDGDKIQKTEWHSIVAYGKLAEIAKNLIRKGELVNVVGELQYRDYEDKDGRKIRVAEIVADKILLLSYKPSSVSESD